LIGFGVIFDLSSLRLARIAKIMTKPETFGAK